MTVVRPSRHVSALDVLAAIRGHRRGLPGFEIIRQVHEATRIADLDALAAVANLWIDQYWADPYDAGDPWTWQRFKPWAIGRLGGVRQTG